HAQLVRHRSCDGVGYELLEQSFDAAVRQRQDLRFQPINLHGIHGEKAVCRAPPNVRRIVARDRAVRCALGPMMKTGMLAKLSLKDAPEKSANVKVPP